MWRRTAARWAALIVGLIAVAACVGWAVLAQMLTTPACALPTPPSNVGFLECPDERPAP